MDLMVSKCLPSGTDAKGLSNRQITKKNVVFYGAAKFRSLRKGYPKSLSGQPMILPTYDSKLRYDIDHWAKVHGIEMNVIAEGQDIATKKLMAIEGLGLLPTATHTVTRQMLLGDLLEIGQMQGVHEVLFLITAQRRLVNPIAAKLMTSFSV